MRPHTFAWQRFPVSAGSWLRAAPPPNLDLYFPKVTEKIPCRRHATLRMREIIKTIRSNWGVMFKLARRHGHNLA